MQVIDVRHTIFFKHSSPWHSTHVAVRSNPCLRHVHKFEPHFLVPGLHLHRITFSKFSGATCMSVLIGISSFSANIHPQSSTFNSKLLSSSTFHEIICWCERKPWKYADRFVGGILSGSTIPLQPMSRYFRCL